MVLAGPVLVFCGHMLISLSFTTAESVAVSFNQKTQYDGIWQGSFSHLNATTRAKTSPPLRPRSASWGQCCSSAVLAAASPGLCSDPVLIN